MMTPIAGPQTTKTVFGQPALPNLNIRLICPNCREDPPNFIEEYAKGDIVCTSCGTILGDRIVDTRSEWRTFAGDENGDDPSRVGDAANPLFGENLETRIGGDSRNGLAGSLHRAASRQGNANKTNKTLSAAFARITEIGEKMAVGRNIITQAQWVFKAAEDDKNFRTKDADPIIAACLVIGCRNNKVDRSLVEISKIVGVEKKKVGQVLLKLNPIIKRAIGDSNSSAVVSTGEQSIKNLLGRYINYLGLDKDIGQASFYIAEKARDQENIVGRSPVSIAAGVLYFTVLLYDRPEDLEKASAKLIAGIAEVSDGTIKHVSKLIATKIDQVIKPNWTSLGGYDRLLAQGKPETAKPSRAGTPKPDVKSENGSPKESKKELAKEDVQAPQA